MRINEVTRKGYVRIKGLPKLRFKDKRVPAGVQPREIHVSRRPNGVYLYFVFDHLEATPPVEKVKTPVGINAGRGRVRWGLSDGSTIERRRVDNKVSRRLQRKMSRQNMGSKSREKTVTQLAKHSHREQIRNRNELHRITAQLVKKYDHFAIEDMTIQGMTRSARGTQELSGLDVWVRTRMNRLILEQTWGEFAHVSRAATAEVQAEEERTSRMAAEARAQEETAARGTAEARVVELEEELRRLRGD